jgi:hypothetical protein
MFRRGKLSSPSLFSLKKATIEAYLAWLNRESVKDDARSSFVPSLICPVEKKEAKVQTQDLIQGNIREQRSRDDRDSHQRAGQNIRSRRRAFFPISFSSAKHFDYVPRVT